MIGAIALGKVALVAWREYLENVRTKAFVIGVFLTPVLMGVIVAAPLLFPDEDRRIAIIDGTGELHALLKVQLESDNAKKERGRIFVIDDPDSVIAPGSEGAADRLARAEERLQARVRAGGKAGEALFGALVIEPDFFTDDQAVREGRALRYHTLKPTDRTIPTRLEGALGLLRRPLRTKQIVSRTFRDDPMRALASIPLVREVVEPRAGGGAGAGPGAPGGAASGGSGGSAGTDGGAPAPAPAPLRVHVCDGTGLVLPSLQVGLAMLGGAAGLAIDDWPAPGVEGAARPERVRLLQMGLDPDQVPSQLIERLAAASAAGAGGADDAAKVRVSFDDARARFRARLESGDLDAFLAVRRELLSRASGPAPGDAVLYLRPGLAKAPVAALEALCREVLWFERAQAEILAANVSPSLTTHNPEKKGEVYEKKDVAAKLLVPFAFVLLLFYGVFGIAQALLNSVIEEKSNRIIEVLLSSLTPLELMLGKILGVGGVGFTLIALWAGGSYATAHVKLGADFLALHVGPGLLGWFGAFYVLGFLLLASVIAAIGATCNTIKEAQNYMAVVSILYIVPVLTIVPVAEQPEGTMARVLSFVPPLTPFVMMNRLAASKTIPLAEVLGSLALLVLAIVAAVWIAARIFRVGILMYGKPPRPGELLRWIWRA